MALGTKVKPLTLKACDGLESTPEYWAKASKSVRRKVSALLHVRMKICRLVKKTELEARYRLKGQTPKRGPVLPALFARGQARSEARLPHYLRKARTP